MVKKRVLDPIPVLDENILLQALRDEGIKELHARAIWNYALAEGKAHGSDATFDNFEKTGLQMSVPTPTGPMLRKRFAILTSRVVEKQLSEDGTVKLLVRLQDGQMVETVIISHGGTHPRTTLCVSSQVGCQMACTFCATGTMGLKGDLTAGEILEQVLHASRVAPIRNVVFMGMGEPLNNYDAVLASIRGMSDSRMFKLSPRHITLSTVGVVPKMKQLTADAPETQLALSLHAPNQELRNKIVPSARAYRLDKLMDALDGHLRGPSAARQLGSPPPPSSSRGPSDTRHVAEYVPVDNDHVSAGNEDVPIDSDHVSVGNEDVPVDSDHLPIGSSNQGENKTESCGDEGPTAGSMDVELHIAGIFTSGGKGVGRRALIEYVMLAGVNDTEECGRELGELLKGRNVVVNLIPYNPTYAPGSEEFKEPTEEALQKFKSIVHDHGLLVTIRRHHGRDIDGACGQLAVRVVAKESSQGAAGDSCGGGEVGNNGDIEDLVANNRTPRAAAIASRRTKQTTGSDRRSSTARAGGSRSPPVPPDALDAVAKGGDASRRDEWCVRSKPGWGQGRWCGVSGKVVVGAVVVGIGVAVTVAYSRTRRR